MFYFLCQCQFHTPIFQSTTLLSLDYESREDVERSAVLQPAVDMFLSSGERDYKTQSRRPRMKC